MGTAAVIVPIKSITRKSRSETIEYEWNHSEEEKKSCFSILFHKILESQRGEGDFGAEWAVKIKAPHSYRRDQGDKQDES